MKRLVLILLALVVTASVDADVKVVQRDGIYVLLRDEEPYFVKGVGGQQNLKLAAACGANSTRTWGIERATEVLDEAASLGMTVTIGYWLDHHAASYQTEDYRNRVRGEISALVDKIKNHPALLCYALGNEINLGADTPEAWTFVGELATRVKRADPGHPVLTVLAGASPETIDRVAQHAPALDLIGFNSYRGLDGLPGALSKSRYTGPYLVTEWGPFGHWEVPKTAWNAPIEQTSTEKAAVYRSAYQIIQKDPGRCLGSYLFLWGQKQERTPTWYGVFIEDRPESGLRGEGTAVIDVMTGLWSGRPAENCAPEVKNISIVGNGDPQAVFAAGSSFTASLPATDPDGDALTHVWEVMIEASRLGDGGSFEPRPESFPGAIRAREGNTVTVSLDRPGNYRLFGYVLDGKGRVGTANLPFQIR